MGFVRSFQRFDSSIVAIVVLLIILAIVVPAFLPNGSYGGGY